MWGSQELLGVLARAYHDATLTGADMRQVAESLENVRDAVARGGRPFDAWEVIDDETAKAYGQVDLPVMIDLRRSFTERVVASEIGRVRAAAESAPETAAREYLLAFAEALTAFRSEIHQALARLDLPLGPPVDPRLIERLRAREAFVRLERWSEACPLFEELGDLELLPDRERARLHAIAARIQVFHYPGRSRSKGLIERALELCPDDPKVLFAQGELLLNEAEQVGRDQIQAAQDCAERALDLDPRLVSARVLLGDCFQKRGDFEAAEEHFREAMRARPGSSSGYENLISLMGDARSGGDLERIPELVDRGRTAEPSDEASLLVAAGYAYSKRGDQEQARRLFAEALERFPEYLNGYQAQAYLLLDLGEKEPARKLLQDAVELAPEVYDGYWGLAFQAEGDEQEADAERWYRAGADKVRLWRGRFLVKAAHMAWKQGRRAEAEQEALAVLKEHAADDFVVEAAERIPDELNQAGDFEGAVQLCDRMLAAVGSSYRPRREKKLGDLCLANGDNAEALKRYRAATALAPERASYHAEVARVLRLEEDWDGARGLLESAPAEVREDESFRHEVARLRNGEANEIYRRGDYHAAIPLYQEAVELAPDDAVMQSNLAGAWERDKSADASERIDRALAALRRASEIAPQMSEYVDRIRQLETSRSFVRDYGAGVLGRLPVVTPVAMEVAVDLIPLVEGEGGGLAAEFGGLVTAMRDSVLADYGVRVPGVRVRGNEADMPAGSYLIMLNEVPIVMGTIALDKRLAVASVERLRELSIDAEPAENPADGDESCWVDEPDWDKVEAAGIELWGVIGYTVKHLQALLERNLADFLGHQEAHNLLMEENTEARLKLRERPETLSPLTAVLRGLLAEQVPIKPFDAICARFLELLDEGLRPTGIVEELRMLPELRPRLYGNRPDTRLYETGDNLVGLLSGSIHDDDGLPLLAMLPEDCQKALAAVRAEVGSATDAGLVLDDVGTRPFARKLFELEFPGLAVLSRRELVQDPVPVGTIRLEDPGP